MTEPTTDRHTCHDQRAATGPAWKCPHCSAAPLPPTVPPAETPREQLLVAIDGTRVPSLGYGTPEELLAAYDASRTSTDPGVLRERIAALFRHKPDEERLGDATPGEIADAVLAVLPATTNHDTDTSAGWLDAAAECNRAGGAYAERGANDAAGAAFALMETFLRKAGEAEYVATPCSVAPCEDGGEPCTVHERLMGHAEGDHELCAPDCGEPWMRRVADETAATETPEWARPETEEEKLAKCRRIAKALSAPPVAPPEWETTTEWPGRHKRPGDRRVHATARFVVNDTQKFWTACGEHVGRGGTPMSHMPVDCRGCKRATAAGARQDGAQPGGAE